MMLWHYTTLACFLQIDQTDEIRPATAFVPEDERPIVWFSTKETWEPTATKGVIDNGKRRDATLAEMTPLVRIGVAEDSEIHHWFQLKKLANMSSRTAEGLELAASHMGSDPRDWWGAFSPIPRTSWVAVEFSKDGSKWESMYETATEMTDGYCYAKNMGDETYILGSEVYPRSSENYIGHHAGPVRTCFGSTYPGRGRRGLHPSKIPLDLRWKPT